MLGPTLKIIATASAVTVFSIALLCQQSKQAPKPDSNESQKKREPGIMKVDERGVRHYVTSEMEKYVPPNIAPASCDEWAFETVPEPHTIGTKCKVMPNSGVNYCWRASNTPYGGNNGGAYDIGPIQGQQKVGQPLTVHFRFRDFGLGDFVIYSFGKVDWGDNAQQDVVPWNVDVPLSHTYTSQRTFVIHAMGGAQFHYQNGPNSGSYEACVDNSIPVIITPPGSRSRKRNFISYSPTG